MAEITWSTKKGDASVHIGHVGKVLIFMIKRSLAGDEYRLHVRTIPSIANLDKAFDWSKMEPVSSVAEAQQLAANLWATSLSRLDLAPKDAFIDHIGSRAAAIILDTVESAARGAAVYAVQSAEGITGEDLTIDPEEIGERELKTAKAKLVKAGILGNPIYKD
jgi:hypothetical protein